MFVRDVKVRYKDIPSCKLLPLMLIDNRATAFAGDNKEYGRMMRRPIPNDLLPFFREASIQEIVTFNRFVFECEKREGSSEADTVRDCFSVLDEDGNYVVYG